MALSKSQQSLKNWTKQNWMTSGTHANKKKGSSKEVKSSGKKRYLPEAAWSSLSAGEKAATNKLLSLVFPDHIQFAVLLLYCSNRGPTLPVDP